MARHQRLKRRPTFPKTQLLLATQIKFMRASPPPLLLSCRAPHWLRIRPAVSAITS
jgi:hypothetical protein